MRQMRPAEAQWYFSPEALEHTPSRDDGIDLETELGNRKRAIEHIRSLWTRAKGISSDDGMEVVAAKGVLTVGATLIHRFYMRRSFADFSEQLIAPTILFLASKIEEESLRLRHIVNVTLDKFEPGAVKWEPQPDVDVPPSPEYKRWERDILAAEEVALEALCFDMSVEQPWTVLRRSLRGLDEEWVEEGTGGEAEAESSIQAQGRIGSEKGGKKAKAKVSEKVITEIGWTLLNEGCLSPLPILFPPPIFAFSVFALTLALTLRIPVSEAVMAAREVAWRFDLDTGVKNGKEGVGEGEEGVDMSAVRGCINKYVEYCQSDLIDTGLLQHFVPDTADAPVLRRLFRLQTRNVNGSSNGTSNGHPVTIS